MLARSSLLCFALLCSAPLRFALLYLALLCFVWKCLEKFFFHLAIILWDSNQNTLLILYYISSKLVTLLKIINALINVSHIFYPTVNFKFISFSFRYSFIFFLKCLLASWLTLFSFCTLNCFASCNHYILAFLLLSKKLNVLYQIMVYAASICTVLDSLYLSFWYSL